MTRALFTAAAVAAWLSGPAAFAADTPRPWQQVVQDREAAAAARPAHYEVQYMYDRHQNYAPRWVLVQ